MNQSPDSGGSNNLQNRANLPDSVLHALEVTQRGCQELLVQTEWIEKLQKSEQSGVPLRIKLGLDPTAPDIHLGHTVVLNKLRQLQDLGHQGVCIEHGHGAVIEVYRLNNGAGRTHSPIRQRIFT